MSRDVLSLGTEGEGGWTSLIHHLSIRWIINAQQHCSQLIRKFISHPGMFTGTAAWQIIQFDKDRWIQKVSWVLRTGELGLGQSRREHTKYRGHEVWLGWWQMEWWVALLGKNIPSYPLSLCIVSNKSTQCFSCFNTVLLMFSHGSVCEKL